MIGVFGGMCPQRIPDISQTVVRAMIAGNVACFMTASIAGERGMRKMTKEREKEKEREYWSLSLLRWPIFE